MSVTADQPDEAPGAFAAGPATVTEALALARSALTFLAGADLTAVPVPVQADVLRGLESLAALHAAAQGRSVSAFRAVRGFEADGQYSARSWLRWQNRMTGAAAGQQVALARRLEAHPRVAVTLARAGISLSWARQIMDWTDVLPEEHRDAADQILLRAARTGAELRDLAELGDQIRRRVAAPDADWPDPEDRWLRLGLTFRGAGRLTGALTPRCAAILRAVLDSLGRPAGPEDIRTSAQRDHDALQELCRRMIAAGGLPDRAGQPLQLQLHLTLDQLLGRAAAGPCCGEPAAAPGDECDATIVPVVTGRIDRDLLDRLAAVLAGQATPPGDGRRCPLRPRGS